MKDDVSARVWISAPACARHVKPRVTRVRMLRPRILTGKLSESQFSYCLSKVLGNVEQCLFESINSSVEENVDEITLARGLLPREPYVKRVDEKYLSFKLQGSLLDLTFGVNFKQAVHQDAWVPSLQKLKFRDNFN